jgi:hypothetical protein
LAPLALHSLCAFEDKIETVVSTQRQKSDPDS